MTQVKSLSMGLMHYFKIEPHAYPDLKPQEMIAFKGSMSQEEQETAKQELENYGYVFEAK